MAKAKKKGLADKVRNKKKNRAKPPANPFELKVNKVKHTVVNKKVQKWEKGNPGLSRSKAVKMRKDTLIRELHHMKKTNSLHDKRFGENDSNLTPDEKMVQRFALEKKKQASKGDFSLNEEEETLTHYGQSLAENLQDTIGTDSEDEEGGTLRTGDLQFGGFAKNGEDVSWKDKMKEVIADSKKQKYDRQVEKQNALEVTNELDSKWKSVIYSFKPIKKDSTGKKPMSSYIQLFRNLVLEQKSHGGTDKLKTEEETAQKEAERLQVLEAERLSRMRGDEKKPERTHVSADDLSDCFALDKPKGESSSGVDKSDSEKEEEDGESENETAQGEEEEEDNTEENDDAGDEEKEDDDEDSEEEEEENYSDLDSEHSDEEEEEEASNSEEEDPKSVAAKAKKSSTPRNKSVADTSSSKKDLPFVFTAPGSFEELETLLHGHDAEEQAIILSRLRKCHHPSLAEGNKEKLKSIHLYVLQYFGKLVAQKSLDKNLISHICACVWETMQTFKEATALAMQKYILQRQAEFEEATQRRKGRGLLPNTELLLHLALIENLFPTSDFRHPVCTPALHFITQMLNQCPVKDGRDVVSGLFLCAQALKYVSLSKRYVPEVITFLHGIFMAGSCIKEKHKCTTFPPYRPSGKAAEVLVVKTQCPKATLPAKPSLSDMMGQDKEYFETDEFKCVALQLALDVLAQCLELWSELPCLDLVTQPLLQPLAALPTTMYPQALAEKVGCVKDQIAATSAVKLKIMQQPSKKPEPLKLFEPKIEEFWSGKRKKGGPNREANERQRMNHKLKREMKAAVREIKRDNEVLAQHQLETVMERDKERKRKTKDLMHSLANQEGDYKAIKRMKK